MRIGLLGYGVVGGGVYELVGARGAKQGLLIDKVLSRRYRAELERVATSDAASILESDSIDTVVEAIGGMEPAFGYVMRALSMKKNVVTANKLMLSHHYGEVMRAARENGASIAFSSSVGGGIPYLVNLIATSAADDIEELGGIMNGTTNYILSAMTEHGADFSETLASAQRLGYAEADPTADIDGLDARCKLAIASSVAWNGALDPEAIPVLGIREISSADIACFSEMGLVCKLVGHAAKTAAGVAAEVMPRLYSHDSAEAGVSGTSNLISFTGRRCGTQSFAGLGAGREPTSYAVYKDVIGVASGSSPFDEVRCESRIIADSYSAAPVRAYVRSAAALSGSLEAEERVGESSYIVKPCLPVELANAVRAMRKEDGASFAAIIN